MKYILPCTIPFYGETTICPTVVLCVCTQLKPALIYNLASDNTMWFDEDDNGDGDDGLVEDDGVADGDDGDDKDDDHVHVYLEV